jgi:DNA topoisomerase-3
LALFDSCNNIGKAVVTKIETSETYKKRPIPLNTVEAQKLFSWKLRISASKSMQIMESLYNRGFISYPRTETNIYNPTINLREIARQF